MTGYDVALRILIALPAGLAFGSFLTVAIHRVPAGESLVRPRSRCPSCGTPIRNVDNVPVVSWLVLRGRCRACGARISAVYPLTELTTGILFVAVALRFEDVWGAVLLAPFLGLMVALTVIDWRHKIIPNRLVYPAIVLTVVYVTVADLAGGGLDAVRAGVGFLAYGLGLLVIALISPRGMGMGDVKLAALVGLALGGLGLRYVAVAAGAGILVGGVAAIVALLTGAGRKAAMPYGPSIAVGAAVAVFAGAELAEAYLRVVGA
ncbi:MAG TPA: prepilin peptidase [Actinomycetota bacterium]|nr:prepilin peptidase [Actinomycetota bacterium]